MYGNVERRRQHEWIDETDDGCASCRQAVPVKLGAFVILRGPLEIVGSGARSPWEPRRSFPPCRMGEPCTLPTPGHRPSGRAYLARKTTFPANRTLPRTTRHSRTGWCQLGALFGFRRVRVGSTDWFGGEVFQWRGVRLDERVVTNRRTLGRFVVSGRVFRYEKSVGRKVLTPFECERPAAV